MDNRIVRITRAFLVLFLLGSLYRGYWVYSQWDHAGATSAYLSFVHGTGPAPFQYRAAPVLIANIFYQHLHWPFRYGFTLEDGITSLAAVLLGYELLRARPLFRTASRALQAVASGAYAALALYLFAWQDYYKKNETDIAALLAILLLVAWTPRWTGRSAGRSADGAADGAADRSADGAADGSADGAARGSSSGLGRSGFIVLGVIALSCIRADVAFTMSLGMGCVALLRRRGELALPRTLAMVVAAVSMLAALGTQAVLMKFVFPHATPYQSHVFMLPYDIGNPVHVLVFLIYAAPSVWALVLAWRMRYTADAAALGCAFAMVPFLILWAALGRLEEVRIFLPVGLTVAVLGAQMALLLAAEKPDAAAAEKLDAAAPLQQVK